MGRYQISVLNSIPTAVIAGIILGFLAGIGVGGGSLLILWLTLVVKLDPAVARIINLMFFITAAGSVSFFRLRQGSIQWKQIFPAVLLGSLSAAVFSLVGRYLDQSLIKRLFGILLLITGLRELLYRPRNAR